MQGRKFITSSTLGALTGKPRPRLCYLPTASADRADGIISIA